MLQIPYSFVLLNSLQILSFLPLLLICMCYVFFSIMHLSTQIFYSSPTSSQLFFCLSVRCYFCRFHICSWRAWRTAVSWKVMFQVSCIMFFCIVLHILLIYYLLFSFSMKSFLFVKCVAQFSSTLFSSSLLILSLSCYISGKIFVCS